MDLDLSTILEQGGLNAVDYQYFNQLFNHRTIIFNRDITEDVVEAVYLPLKDFEEDDVEDFDMETDNTLVVQSLMASF